MAADVSRVRMNPLRDHSGVGLQQGRVLPDSDLNELIDILDRRLRAQVADQRPAGVAQVSRLTPDAFNITVENGELTIGRGRMYVDGLLAENHGTPGSFEFDPVLAEPTFDDSGDPVDFFSQPYPYWPRDDETVPLPGGGPHLVYIDVWQRELTYINAPHLVEPAIGVDTTTRTQTVWQVHLLPDVGNEVTCDGTIEGWDELVASSPVRLSTGTVPVDPADDPYCELPPTGGYRGLENHLYRVELHDDGTQPKFKWSRDNANIASPVVEWISRTELRLARLRRDDLIRFADNDWVEITNDRRELAGSSGELRQISVDEATDTISFEDPLQDDLTPPNGEAVTERHLRVIKWDGIMAMPEPNTAVELEHGITVEFGGDPGRGRAGDYWVFAARTNDASIETHTDAPPRGIHHHYARLALVTFPNTATDCRPFDPQPSVGCACEVCVTAHQLETLTIQQAIDRARAARGGTITLCPGEYELNEPLVLQDAHSIVLRGPGAVIRAQGTAIEVRNMTDVTITGLRIISSGTDPAVPAVVLEHCGAVSLDRVGIEAPGVGIALAGEQWLTALRRNVIIADVGVRTIPRREARPSNGLRIEDNTFVCRERGIQLTDTSQFISEVRIANNVVTATTQVGIAARGLLIRGPEAVVDGVLTIVGNAIETVSGVGIRTAGRAVISDNEITSNRSDPRDPNQHGIHVAAEEEKAGHVHIIGNRAVGLGGLGILVEAEVASLSVKQNVVQDAGGGIVVRGGPKQHISIENNHIIDVVNYGTASGIADNAVVGIAVVDSVGSAHLVGNVIDGVAARRIGDRETAAVLAMTVYRATDVLIAGNTITNAGALARQALGIGVSSPREAVSVTDNTVHAASGADEVARAFWTTLLVMGSPILPLSPLDPPVHVAGNRLFGGGRKPAVSILTTGHVLVSTNRIVQRDLPSTAPALELQASRAVLQGNVAFGGRTNAASPAIRLTVNKASLVVVGNMTSPGAISVRATVNDEETEIDLPWRPLNPVLP
ncbi:DUF6519 domain-containing protein [Nocardia gipuzkoensis]